MCAAVLHEVFAIYNEMEEDAFQCLPIAFGNDIVDEALASKCAEDIKTNLQVGKARFIYRARDKGRTKQNDINYNSYIQKPSIMAPIIAFLCPKRTFYEIEQCHNR